MALPRLNEVPEYELVIPSTKENIQFRPFLVKEQKILLMAFESRDTKQIMQAIGKTIESCIPDIKLAKLASFDIDYIFMQIRSKSVGEKANLNIKCKHCEHPNPVEVDLENVQLTSEPKDKMVKLTDDMTMQMKYPSFFDVTNSDMVREDITSTEMAIESIKMSMDALITEEEHISMKDETNEEIARFVDSLNDEQFSKLAAFIQDIPKLILNIDFTCESCNKENNHVMEGINDFFS